LAFTIRTAYLKSGSGVSQRAPFRTGSGVSKKADQPAEHRKVVADFLAAATARAAESADELRPSA
jgi:hypothetical protein